MRVALFAALACVLTLACAETYTLLHRTNGKGDAAWSARALVALETGQEPGYVPVSDSVAPADGATSYQLMLVPGDVRGQRAAQLHALEKAHPIASTALCQLYTGSRRQDNVDIHLSGLHPVALAFSVSLDMPLDAHGCPSNGTLASEVETSVQAFGAVVPDAPIRKAREVPTEQGPDGKPKPKQEKSFIQRYWYYLIPLVVLLILPGSEEVPDPMRPPNTGATSVRRIVQPGPSARRP